jgi:hypothetical protein
MRRSPATARRPGAPMSRSGRLLDLLAAGAGAWAAAALVLAVLVALAMTVALVLVAGLAIADAAVTARQECPARASGVIGYGTQSVVRVVRLLDLAAWPAAEG